MTRKIIFVLSLFVVLFPLLYLRFNLVSVQAVNGDNVHNLDTNLNYTTIQDAIDAVETDDGHTILVDAGIYYEHVVVDKSLSFIGQNLSTTIIDGSGNGTVFTITRDDVNVTGFTIQNSGGPPEMGFHLDNANHCNITGNNMRNNALSMRIRNSSNNTVSGNNIKDNSARGFYFDNSSGNMFYHNNVVDNIDQVVLNDVFSDNVWDNGVEGNYWSNYTGVDLLDGGDGIGDSPHDIDEDNTDRFPLMGPISFFDAGTWDETAYYVHAVSNSTISDFNFNVSSQMVSFNVTGSDGTPGFCRVAIPRELLWCDDIFGWTVRVNGTSVPIRIQEYAEYTYLYFTYSHSVQNVEVYGTQVIPEFSSIIILLLFMIATVTAALNYRRKRSS